jgi:hypothetical protein
MDCRRFRSQHLSYLDDTLCGQTAADMQSHLAQCSGCASHDALIRRSLVLARNLAPIAPSADFQARLQQRLRELPADSLLASDGVAGDHGFLIPARGWQPSRFALAAVAASMVVMTSVAYYRAEPAREAARQLAASQPLLPDPIPMSGPSPLPDQFVSAVISGNPVLPAALVATQAPIEFLTGVQPVGLTTNYPSFTGLR